MAGGLGAQSRHPRWEQPEARRAGVRAQPARDRGRANETTQGKLLETKHIQFPGSRSRSGGVCFCTGTLDTLNTGMEPLPLGSESSFCFKGMVITITKMKGNNSVLAK